MAGSAPDVSAWDVAAISDSNPSKDTHEPSTAVTVALLSSCALSVIGGAWVFISYRCWRHLRRHPAPLIAWRAVMDIGFCCLFVAAHIYHRLYHRIDSKDCAVLSFFTQYFALAAELYFLMLSLDVVISLHNPFTNYKCNNILYHLAANGLAIVSGIVLISAKAPGHDTAMYGRDAYLDICWVRRDAGSDSPALYLVLFFLGPLVAIYIVAVLALLYTQRRLKQGLPETFEVRLSVFRSSFRFVASFTTYWVTALGVYGIAAELDTQAPANVLPTLLGIALGLRGIVTFLVWTLTYGRRAPACSKHKPQAGRKNDAAHLQQQQQQNEDPNDGVDLRPHLNVWLRREILYYTTLGIAKSVVRATRDPHVDGRGHPGVPPNIAFNLLALSRRKEERGLFALERHKITERSRSLQQASGGGQQHQQQHGEHGAGVGTNPGTGLSSRNPFFSASVVGLVNLVSGTFTTLGQGQGQGSGGGGDNKGHSRGTGGGGDTRSRVASTDGDEDHHHVTVNLHEPLLARGEETDDDPTTSAAAQHARGMSNNNNNSGGGNAFQRRYSYKEARRRAERVADAQDQQHQLPVGAAHNNGHVRPGAQTAAAGRAGAGGDRSGHPLGSTTNTGAAAGRSSGGGGGRELARFMFTDFEPHLFAAVRRAAGISTSSYITALSRTTREKFSEGSSGAWLYFSRDERFIVKTLTSAEAGVLMGMLRDYASYSAAFPNNLLTRFYGLHCIRMYGRSMFFVVMGNILPPGAASVHERYDLKGSWVGRHRTLIEMGQLTECRYCGQNFRVAAEHVSWNDPDRMAQLSAQWSARAAKRQHLGAAAATGASLLLRAPTPSSQVQQQNSGMSSGGNSGGRGASTAANTASARLDSSYYVSLSQTGSSLTLPPSHMPVQREASVASSVASTAAGAVIVHSSSAIASSRAIDATFPAVGAGVGGSIHVAPLTARGRSAPPEQQHQQHADTASGDGGMHRPRRQVSLPAPAAATAVNSSGGSSGRGALSVGTCPARPNRPHEPNTIMKDNDLTYKLHLPHQTAVALGDQIVSDCEFLRSHGITDYSLLLGVHRTKYKLVDMSSGLTGGGGSATLGGGLPRVSPHGYDVAVGPGHGHRVGTTTLGTDTTLLPAVPLASTPTLGPSSLPPGAIIGSLGGMSSISALGSPALPARPAVGQAGKAGGGVGTGIRRVGQPAVSHTSTAVGEMAAGRQANAPLASVGASEPPFGSLPADAILPIPRAIPGSPIPTTAITTAHSLNSPGRDNLALGQTNVSLTARSAKPKSGGKSANSSPGGSPTGLRPQPALARLLLGGGRQVPGAAGVGMPEAELTGRSSGPVSARRGGGTGASSTSALGRGKKPLPPHITGSSSTGATSHLPDDAQVGPPSAETPPSWGFDFTAADVVGTPVIKPRKSGLAMQRWQESVAREGQGQSGGAEAAHALPAAGAVEASVPAAATAAAGGSSSVFSSGGARVQSRELALGQSPVAGDAVGARTTGDSGSRFGSAAAVFSAFPNAPTASAAVPIPRAHTAVQSRDTATTGHAAGSTEAHAVSSSPSSSYATSATGSAPASPPTGDAGAATAAANSWFFMQSDDGQGLYQPEEGEERLVVGSDGNRQGRQHSKDDTNPLLGRSGLSALLRKQRSISKHYSNSTSILSSITAAAAAAEVEAEEVAREQQQLQQGEGRATEPAGTVTQRLEPSETVAAGWPAASRTATATASEARPSHMPVPTAGIAAGTLAAPSHATAITATGSVTDLHQPSPTAAPLILPPPAVPPLQQQPDSGPPSRATSFSGGKNEHAGDGSSPPAPGQSTAGAVFNFPSPTYSATQSQQAATTGITARSLFQNYRGGMRATVVDGPGIYRLGLVDMLQTYTWDKKAERFLKKRVLLKPGDGLSCMAPTPYARRFIARVIGQLIDGYTPPEEPLPLSVQQELVYRLPPSAARWVWLDCADPAVTQHQGGGAAAVNMGAASGGSTAASDSNSPEFFDRFQAQLARQRLLWLQHCMNSSGNGTGAGRGAIGSNFAAAAGKGSGSGATAAAAAATGLQPLASPPFAAVPLPLPTPFMDGGLQRR